MEDGMERFTHCVMTDWSDGTTCKYATRSETAAQVQASREQAKKDRQFFDRETGTPVFVMAVRIVSLAA
jgi:hypothetical protein